MSIIVTVEGILRRVTDGTGIPPGIYLIRQLAQHEALNSFVYLTRGGNPEEVEDWLDQQGLPYDMVLASWSEDPVKRIRAMQQQWGYTVEYIIEPDPALAAEFVREGWMTIGFFHPYYAKPEWRPDYQETVQPWASLSEQVANAAKMKATDKRITDVVTDL